jgi:4-hydroxy-tetrahydrodipicolinate synthase
MGGNDTHELLEHINSFDLSGVDALLSVTPYYNRPSQEGLYRHYAQLAESTDLPIILYNVPFRTGCNLTADTTLRLAGDFPSIVGTKEASGNFEQIADILRNRPLGFKVYSGDDLLSLPFISLGADGVISVVANAYPNAFSEMVQMAMAGNYKRALVWHEQLLPAVKHIFQEGSPAGVKAILAQRGMIQPHLRLPLVGISEKLKAELKKLDEHWVGPK